MNTTILKKCLEELGTQEPRLDYIRGILETLVDMQPLEFVDQDGYSWVPTPGQQRAIKQAEEDASKRPQDEASLLDAKARAALETVKAMNTEA